MKVSDLSEIRRQHLAWRLDSKTVCGLLTACKIARNEIMQDKTVAEIFEWAGCTPRSAKIHATKVANFAIANPNQR